MSSRNMCLLPRATLHSDSEQEPVPPHLYPVPIFLFVPSLHFNPIPPHDYPVSHCYLFTSVVICSISFVICSNPPTDMCTLFYRICTSSTYFLPCCDTKQAFSVHFLEGPHFFKTSLKTEDEKYKC